MEYPSVGRRRLLAGAGAAAGGILAAGVAATPVGADPDKDRRSSAEGSWLAKRFDPGDGVERTFVINFGRGGVCTSIDINPVLLNGAGAWSSRGRLLTATVWYGTDEIPDVLPAAFFEVKPVATVDGDQLTGTFTFTVFLAQTGDPIGEGGGTWSGTRITA